MSNILRVDLTTGDSSAEEVTYPAIHGLGGKTLAIEFLERHLDPTIDPLAPDNVLIFTPSPLIWCVIVTAVSGNRSPPQGTAHLRLRPATPRPAASRNRPRGRGCYAKSTRTRSAMASAIARVPEVPPRS